MALSDMGAMNTNDRLAFNQLYVIDVSVGRRFLGIYFHEQAG
jgi:hypothetical protein